MPSYASAAAAHAAPPAPSYQLTPYTPGDISFADIPDFTAEDLAAQLGHYTPGDLSDLAPSALDTQLAAAASDLLAHPTGLSDQAIAELKAKSKDEIAEQADADRRNLIATSYARGLQDSDYTAAAQQAARLARDQALIGSNRDIDLQAAETRAADERAALSTVAGVAGQQAAQRLSADQLREQTSQASASSQQAAVSTATQAALQRASLTGNRMALRESVNQAAAQLGISAAQLQQQWTIAQMQDATQRLGLQLNADQFAAELQERGREFAENLSLQLATLKQNDEQFGAIYDQNEAHFAAEHPPGSAAGL
jgi:hypothetical protein